MSIESPVTQLFGACALSAIALLALLRISSGAFFVVYDLWVDRTFDLVG